MNKNINNQFPAGAVLIFGATGGIGRVVAHEFAKAGSDVAVIWRSKQQQATELCQDIEALGRKSSLHHCDVTDHEQLLQAVKEAIATHGRIHTLVWGAGPLVEQVLINEATREQWRNAVDVEVHGFYDASKAVLAHMREQGGGSIVHLGSAGDLSFPERDFLSVSPKAANESLIRVLPERRGGTIYELTVS